MKVRRLIAEDFAAVWGEGVDLLLTPTTLSSAPPLHKFTGLSNREQCDTQDYCTQPANMAGGWTKYHLTKVIAAFWQSNWNNLDLKML